MNFDLSQLQSLVAGLMWPLARVSGLLLTAPVLGANSIPPRVKIGLALLLALVLVPLAPSPGAVDPLSIAALVTVMQQLVVGAAIGFALKLAFEALSFAGDLVASTMGLGFAQVVDPQQGHGAPALGQFYVLLATLIFLALNGHLELIALLATGMHHASWQAAMPGGNQLWNLLEFASHLFTGAVLVALPALASLLVVNFGFGAISRAAPSMNLFSIGFPITICLGFVVVWLSLRTLPGAFDALQRAAFVVVRALAGI
ncbi:MAG TPA: flagellar biosynthetic protein FliR [Rhodanobacteraceae bacterium]|nr:flagellar biosynthetic protein FliR [Rhodanobacteraceae bacterium]